MAKLIDPKKTILVVVDIQEKLFPLIRFNDMVLGNSLRIIELAKIAGIPIIVTEQYRKGLGETLPEIKDAIPDFAPLEKAAFGCFGDPPFVSALKKFKKRDTLVLVGMETHVCIYQTAMEALEDYRVYVPVDAVSSQSKGDWATALERMKEKGVDMVSTDMLLFEILKESGTKEFKKALPILKEKPWEKNKRGPVAM